MRQHRPNEHQKYPPPLPPPLWPPTPHTNTPKDKDKYISLERLRWSSAFSIPIATEMPPDFPALTLPTMRALAVLYDESGGEGGDQTKLVAALDVLYAATWVERKATHKGDVLREVLGGVLGEGEAGRGMFLFFWVSWGGGGGGGWHHCPAWVYLHLHRHLRIHPSTINPHELGQQLTPTSPPSLDNNRQGPPAQADRVGL